MTTPNESMKKDKLQSPNVEPSNKKESGSESNRSDHAANSRGTDARPATTKPDDVKPIGAKSNDEDTDLADDLGPKAATRQGAEPKMNNPGGRSTQGGIPGSGDASRGSSIQGERQDAKGGPQGANQGGAPRGGSRIEPSHAHDAAKKDRR